MKGGDKEFELGDKVMEHLKRGRFSVGTYNKQKIMKSGPCNILGKFDSRNAYGVTR